MLLRRTDPSLIARAIGVAVAILAVIASTAAAQRPAALTAAADSFLAITRSSNPTSGWNDLSDSTRIAGFRRVDRVHALLRSVDPATLRTAADTLLHENLAGVVDAQVGARVCRYHLWSGTSQFGGWHVNASNTARSQAVGSDSAREAALAQFRALPARIRAEQELLQRGLDSGYTQSQDVIAAVIRQVDDLLPADPAASPLWSPAQRDSTPAFREQWAAMLRDVVYPAGQRYREFLARDYLPRARSEGSLASLPAGVGCYTAGLRSQTTLTIDLAAYMADARREGDRLRDALAPLVLELTGQRDVGRGINILRTDPRFAFAHRDSILPAYRAATKLAESRLGRVITGFAPESIAVVPYPLFQERSGLPPQYLRASDDGRRPAQFMVNLSRTERMAVPNAVAHEAWPGHHLQRIAAARAPVVHPVMRNLSAGSFVEGWGIYSEELADDMGLYATPLERAGYLIHLLDVAVGFWLDAGYHTKGWTRAMLVDSMMVIGGRARANAEVYADRHAGTPGQLATYFVGWRAIVNARREAERRLGTRFRAPEFNREVIRDGYITLGSMQRKLAAWPGVAGPATSGTRSPE